MTQIDFYLLNDTNANAREMFACRLVGKIYGLKQSVYLLVESPEATKHMDDLLWTFNDISFLPHSISTEKDKAPIIIGDNLDQTQQHNILINLTLAIPNGYDKFKRIVEIIPPDDNWRAHGRQHYKKYQQQGQQVKAHHIQ